MRAPASTSVAPLAIAIASARSSTSAQRGATSTRSEKPITLIARAAAPTLPAWLVPTRTKRVGSAGIAAAKMRVAHFAARPHRGPAVTPPPTAESHLLPCPKRCTRCSTSPSRRRAPPGRSSTARRSTSSGCRSAPRRRTTSSPRSTTPPRRRSSTCCSRAYPGHGILAEESGSARGARDSEYVWIIDPLDGTTNFIHGLPTYAVSIGLAFRDQIQQAVVYDPARNDLFFASKGRGAFLNDKRLRVSKRTRMADALIGTGFPFRKGDDLAHYLRMLETVMKSCAGVRRPGAAALDLCYVAAGWYDGFFETGLSPWDVAAGSLIVTEAGGLVGNFTGEADFLHQREVVAGSPKIYGQLVQMLAPHTNVARGAADETAA